MRPLTAPHDSFLIYHWVAASVPPPFHYEYDIRIGPGGSCEVVFWPDYPAPAVPEWRELFSVSSTDVAQLYSLMLKDGFPEPAMPALSAQPFCGEAFGGEAEWLTFQFDGRRVEFPPRAPGEGSPEEGSPEEPPSPLDVVYKSVRALVPPKIWQDLHERRARYVEENSLGGGG